MLEVINLFLSTNLEKNTRNAHSHVRAWLHPEAARLVLGWGLPFPPAAWIKPQDMFKISDAIKDSNGLGAAHQLIPKGSVHHLLCRDSLDRQTGDFAA